MVSKSEHVYQIRVENRCGTFFFPLIESQNQYKATKDPYSVALFYVALKKLPQLAMLFKVSKQEKLQCFFWYDL